MKVIKASDDSVVHSKIKVTSILFIGQITFFGAWLGFHESSEDRDSGHGNSLYFPHIPNALKTDR